MKRGAGGHPHHVPVPSVGSLEDETDGQSRSFLDCPDILWHEKPVEEVITRRGNGTWKKGTVIELTDASVRSSQLLLLRGRKGHE